MQLRGENVVADRGVKICDYSSLLLIRVLRDVEWFFGEVRQNVFNAGE